jgi:FkbM family methyltransferase
MYSQNDEEKYILEYFGGKADGRFLDIGAGDWDKFSNVRALHEKGWSGVAVEPSPYLWPALMELPRLLVIKAALASFTGRAVLYNAPGLTSSLDKRSTCRHPNKVYHQTTVPTRTWSEILRTCGRIDFVNLDIEGANLPMFRLMPRILKREASMFCIEHDGRPDVIEKDLADFGFSRYHITGENILMAKGRVYEESH